MMPFVTRSEFSEVDKFRFLMHFVRWTTSLLDDNLVLCDQ